MSRNVVGRPGVGAVVSTRLGRYRIVSQGRLGVVDEADDPYLDRTVHAIEKRVDESAVIDVLRNTRGENPLLLVMMSS